MFFFARTPRRGNLCLRSFLHPDIPEPEAVLTIKAHVPQNYGTPVWKTNCGTCIAKTISKTNGRKRTAKIVYDKCTQSRKNYMPQKIQNTTKVEVVANNYFQCGKVCRHRDTEKSSPWPPPDPPPDPPPKDVNFCCSKTISRVLPSRDKFPYREFWKKKKNVSTKNFIYGTIILHYQGVCLGKIFPEGWPWVLGGGGSGDPVVVNLLCVQVTTNHYYKLEIKINVIKVKYVHANRNLNSWTSKNCVEQCTSFTIL